MRQRGAGGRSEPGDRFGAAVAIRDGLVLVGAPGEDLGSNVDAGAANSFRLVERWFSMRDRWWSGPQQITEGSGRFPGSPGAGDRFGAAVAIRDDGSPVVGAPGERVGTQPGAGAVFVWDRAITLGSGGVPGTASAGDGLGASLAVGERVPVLVVGVPGDDVGTVADAGAVLLLGTANGAASLLSASSPGIAGAAEPGDAFGGAVGLG
jgi:hypothetical protein